jgi:hypothetical protein
MDYAQMVSAAPGRPGSIQFPELAAPGGTKSLNAKCVFKSFTGP